MILRDSIHMHEKALHNQDINYCKEMTDTITENISMQNV